MDRISQDATIERRNPRPRPATYRALAPDAALDWSELLTRISGAAHAAAAIQLVELAKEPVDHDGLGGLP